MVREDDEMLSFFSSLGSDELTEDLHKKAEKIVCRFYGDKKVESVNELRYKLFRSRLRKNGKVDLSLLPPFLPL